MTINNSETEFLSVKHGQYMLLIKFEPQITNFSSIKMSLFYIPYVDPTRKTSRATASSEWLSLIFSTILLPAVIWTQQGGLAMRTALKGDVIVISMKLRKNGIFEFRSLWMMCSKVCEQFSAASKEAVVSVPIVMLTSRILYMNPVISQSSSGVG